MNRRRAVPNVILSSVSIEDLPAFMAMERADDTRTTILADDRGRHVDKLNDPSVVYLRIEVDDEPAGFIILVLDPDGISVEFQRIVVANKGRGIGQAAIEALHAYCAEQLQRERIWLDVFDFNARARHIYEKMGYRTFAQRHFQGRTLVCYERYL